MRSSLEIRRPDTRAPTVASAALDIDTSDFVSSVRCCFGKCSLASTTANATTRIEANATKPIRTMLAHEGASRWTHANNQAYEAAWLRPPHTLISIGMAGKPTDHRRRSSNDCSNRCSRRPLPLLRQQRQRHRLRRDTPRLCKPYGMRLVALLLARLACRGLVCSRIRVRRLRHVRRELHHPEHERRLRDIRRRDSRRRAGRMRHQEQGKPI
ncbi:hypothetical protein FBZ94_103762 [Bradyrhizobium sacchari]|uniref:Uncharacterized protein n=1 Tax=Bradyrhizobium sacchari TaxID=1399419 RepID=A0A560JY58_9BRAD|nr:hypothetical protein FBZ94_103762 [Bradyrhizobium sacchari]TWB76008.1 hypothetical protein FBZ95_104188 [Bradyrhizobium sacchari]